MGSISVMGYLAWFVVVIKKLACLSFSFWQYKNAAWFSGGFCLSLDLKIDFSFY